MNMPILKSLVALIIIAQEKTYITNILKMIQNYHIVFVKFILQQDKLKILK